MEFIDVVKKREAIRKYKSDVVDSDTINKILEVARLAPTAKNMQPQMIYVVTSKEGLDIIDKSSPCRYNAPVVLLVCGNKNIACKVGNDSTIEMDTSIVATHLMLAATNYGVDNTWIKAFDKDIIKSEFNLEDEIVPICMILLGYRSDNYIKNPQHDIRKPLSETVKYK